MTSGKSLSRHQGGVKHGQFALTDIVMSQQSQLKSHLDRHPAGIVSRAIAWTLVPQRFSCHPAPIVQENVTGPTAATICVKCHSVTDTVQVLAFVAGVAVFSCPGGRMP
jgi:hypothetical protein